MGVTLLSRLTTSRRHTPVLSHRSRQLASVPRPTWFFLVLGQCSARRPVRCRVHTYRNPRVDGEPRAYCVHSPGGQWASSPGSARVLLPRLVLVQCDVADKSLGAVCAHAALPYSLPSACWDFPTAIWHNTTSLYPPRPFSAWCRAPFIPSFIQHTNTLHSRAKHTHPCISFPDSTSNTMLTTRSCKCFPSFIVSHFSR
jgi:hypothetical protein